MTTILLVLHFGQCKGSSTVVITNMIFKLCKDCNTNKLLVLFINTPVDDNTIKSLTGEPVAKVSPQGSGVKNE